MNTKIRKQIERRKRRIAQRLDKNDNRGCDRPIMTASNIHYEIADRTRATAHGGIGALHLLVRKPGLDQAIDAQLGFRSRYVAEGATLKPESGCSGPFSPRTARSATETDMKHDIIRNLAPTSVVSAACGVAQPHGKQITPNAFGVRLFKG